MFAYRIVVLQVQLAFYRYGVWSVDVGDVLRVFDGMRLELRTLMPADSLAAL
jgi:hypothetical protein